MIDLAFGEIDLPDGVRREPLFGPTTVVADLTEAMRLDPARVGFNSEPEPPQRSVGSGSISSLLLHLLPLLVLLSWLRPPIEIPPPIPIQLVIEQPPKPLPRAQPAPAAKPPPGLRASDDLGAVGPPSTQKGTDTEPPIQNEPQSAAASAQVTEPPPEPPVEAAQPASVAAPPSSPKPTPPKQMAARLPKPEGLVLPLPLHPDRPRDASASARYPGPDASRDEYCAYALSLTLKHLDLLPSSLVGARRGDTIVLIQVREDGTITSARVIRGSGYLDIDERVAQMARAVGQYPPLPRWLPGPVADFTFHLHFPDQSER